LEKKRKEKKRKEKKRKEREEQNMLTTGMGYSGRAALRRGQCNMYAMEWPLLGNVQAL
jgi:hypothetical protein